MSENNKTFEEKLARLEEIINKMNEGNAPLDEMLSLYQEAQEIIKEESEILEKAKAKINEYSK